MNMVFAVNCCPRVIIFTYRTIFGSEVFVITTITCTSRLLNPNDQKQSNEDTRPPSKSAHPRRCCAMAFFNFFGWSSRNAHGKVIKLVQGIAFPAKATMLDNLDGALAVGVDWGTRMYRRNT